MKNRDYYVTFNNNIFNPYLRCFHTVDGKFLRSVDSDESDYLKEVLDIYPNSDEVIEPKEVPNKWNFLFELEDDSDCKALCFTKKTEKRRFFKVVYVPSSNLGLGYVRIEFNMIGYKTYNSDSKKLNELLKKCGNSISYKELIKLVTTFSKEPFLVEWLNVLKELMV